MKKAITAITAATLALTAIGCSERELRVFGEPFRRLGHEIAGTPYTPINTHSPTGMPLREHTYGTPRNTRTSSKNTHTPSRTTYASSRNTINYQKALDIERARRAHFQNRTVAENEARTYAENTAYKQMKMKEQAERQRKELANRKKMEQMRARTRALQRQRYSRRR
jgi:hypothetical protein